MRRPQLTAVRAAVLVGAFALLAGCSSSSGDGSDGVLSPGPAPSGWNAQELAGVQLSTPTDWESYETDPPAGGGDDVTAAGMKMPLGPDGAGGSVYVVTSGSPTKDAKASSANSRSVGEATLGAEDVVEEDLTWPGADKAAYLAYEADLPMPSGDDVRFRYETLTLDLPDGSQSIVTVVGPVARYEETGQHDILASVTVGE
jgi:hypothetical protein